MTISIFWGDLHCLCRAPQLKRSGLSVERASRHRFFATPQQVHSGFCHLTFIIFVGVTIEFDKENFVREE